MAQPSALTGETSSIVTELQNLFSGKHPNRKKMETLILNFQSVQNLLSQLPDMISKYERQGKKIDQQREFVEILKKFKNIIEGNINKSIYDPEILLVINYLILAIRQGYELFLNHGQTLEEINKIIEKEISFGNKKEIGTLIIRSIEMKIPKEIYFDQKDPNNDERKLVIIMKFYDYFVQYVLYIRESLDDMLNDENYRSKLDKLQAILLNTKPSNIEDYFLKLKSRMITKRGYSTEILLEYLVKNENVHINVSNRSDYYCEHLNEIFAKPLKKKSIDSLSNLVFKLQDNSFEHLCEKLIENNDVFQSIYNIGIDLYLIETRKIMDAKEKKQNTHFYPDALENREQLKRKFKLFLLVSLGKATLIKIRDSIINEGNAKGTYLILADIYGLRIQHLDFSDEIINVKYCFNHYFFKSLSYHELDDVNVFSECIRLLFYIHTCEDRDKLHYQNEKTHRNKLLELKESFLKTIKNDNRRKLNDLIEIFKVMINIQSFESRLKYVTSAINSLEQNDDINVKVFVLKEFLGHQDAKKEICLRLAQSFNIDLMKHISDNKQEILTKLRNFNSNFDSFIKYLEKSELEFNIEKELTPGLSIPYYLSAILADDPKYNIKIVGYNEETNEIAMSILFKVFTCSSENDKEVFLKNQNSIHQEFNQLYQSVKKLIEFYNVSGNAEINKKLRGRSIKHILHGFSGTHQKSLAKRNEYARTIIDNFINYNLKQIDQIIESTESDTEVLNLFDVFMKRNASDDLERWAKNTGELRDQINFLHAHHHYKETNFNEWYQNWNSNESFNIIQNNREKVKKDLQTHHKAFELINIKYLQHNQIGALTLIYDYLTDESKKNSNLFIKIGTGQGKSLTIAETARQLVQNNPGPQKPKVFVVTCYDHLAKRDHDNYQKYYQYFNISTMYCSSESSTKDFSNSDVIYADLNTYFTVLRKEGHNALIDGTSIELPKISNTVLIMDEFDSLIIDSDELLQYVYDFEVRITNPNVNFDKKEDLVELFDSTFIRNCNSKFSNIFDHWFESKLSHKRKEDNNQHQKKVQDSLGKDSTMAQSLLNYLKNEKKAHFVHYFLDALVFYSQFKQVIGFSGSIEKEHINKFQRLFNNKVSHYYDIPPFFGPGNSQQNRTFVNDPGQVRENTQEFLDEIREEIKQRYRQQPILIFADSYKEHDVDESDYDGILKMLKEAQNTFLHDRKIIEINTEKHIAENIHKIGKLDSITLATRIIGRGADIKVDKCIKKGLHLLLTYYPPRENIYIQMLGRTARQDESGSYSIITRQHRNFTPVRDVAVNSRDEKMHNITEYFYRNYHRCSNKRNARLKWPLLSELLKNLSKSEIEKYSLAVLEEFVNDNILK
ncbi:unnamed protein product [Adineta steineri]|uniref:Helicase C-terminal domain-containing protein n=1 Tax=Adineta steineri TaxID=433720 RepID=A0A818MIV9_9BILA|nr:unnamed protein product [Adineta steineri]CAF3589997.1 unnamed protein product [Adineta steineri]